jgi:hypothetical protein
MDSTKYQPLILAVSATKDDLRAIGPDAARCSRAELTCLLKRLPLPDHSEHSLAWRPQLSTAPVGDCPDWRIAAAPLRTSSRGEC